MQLYTFIPSPKFGTHEYANLAPSRLSSPAIDRSWRGPMRLIKQGEIFFNHATITYTMTSLNMAVIQPFNTSTLTLATNIAHDKSC